MLVNNIFIFVFMIGLIHLVLKHQHANSREKYVFIKPLELVFCQKSLKIDKCKHLIVTRIKCQRNKRHQLIKVQSIDLSINIKIKGLFFFTF